MRGAVGGHIGPTNYYTILQFFRTSDIPALLSFGSDGLIANETRRRNVGSGGAVGDASGLPITTRSPNLLKLPTSLHCNHSEVMDRHLGPSHVLSSIIDRSERKKIDLFPRQFSIAAVALHSRALRRWLFRGRRSKGG